MMVSGMVKKRLKPLVSVVMPAFNAERFLEEAVLSVLGQTLSNFELILLNDGSTDRTRNVIEAFSEHDSRVRFFDFEQNQGKPAVVNFGMNHARGKFACIFDSDDVMVNYKLEVSAGILERHNESGLVYGDAWVINERSRITGPFSFPSRKKRGLDDAFAPNPFSFARLCRKNFIPGGSVLFRTKDFLAAGGLDPRLKIGEDWDLWLRLTKDKQAYYLPVPLYLYRINSQGLISRFLKSETGRQNLRSVRFRHGAKDEESANHRKQ